MTGMAEYPDRPGYSFNPGPPPEASRFLKNKGLRPSFSWMDVEPEEHAVSFAAAKMTEIDLLQAARAEVQKALDEGLPFEAFQKNWMDRPALAEWLGKREYTDPLTGDVVEVKRNPARRLKTIYNANLRSARAAGQWERIERTKAAFPYLEYRLGPSERHRPKHVEKAGLIISVDSPFWDEWMPPNGWGCQCWVRQVTRREAERRGISATPDIPDTKWVNPRTGDQRLVPVGIDPGWERNPGKLRLQAMEALLRDRLEAVPVSLTEAAVRDIATSWAAERVLAGTSPAAVPVAVLPRSLADAAGIDATVVRMTSEYGQKFRDKKRLVTAATLLELVSAAKDGEVVLQTGESGPSLILRSRSQAPWMFVLKLILAKGEIWVRTIHPDKGGKFDRIKSAPESVVLRE
jgi:hypothetical protein